MNVLPATQMTMSKLWRKHKALTINCNQPHSFCILHWALKKGHCSLCASNSISTI